MTTSFFLFSDIKPTDEFTANHTWVVRGKKEDIQNISTDLEMTEVQPGFYQARIGLDNDTTFSEIEAFLKRHKNLKITGFLPYWSRYGIEVYAFYSESGSENALIRFIASSDGHIDCDSRWYYSVDVTSEFDTKSYWLNSGEYDRIHYAFSWKDYWNNFERTDESNIIIPNTVTSIGSSAFEGCTSLQSVTIPNSVTSIGSSAFEGCTSLQSVTIPNSVTSIGYAAFSYCKSLQSIMIPDSVTSIGYAAFLECTSLQGTTYDNAVYLGNKNNPFLFLWKVQSEEISSCIINERTKIVGVYAFAWCTSLQSVTIPDSVTSIGDCAFYGCSSLTSISIPDSVTSIGYEAFYGCSRLTSITIPDGVTSIGFSAFRGCSSLTSIVIPDSVTSIGKEAFEGCENLQSICSPKLSMETWASSELKRAATLGYLQKREIFLDTDIAAAYKKYAVGQRKKLIPVIFKNDEVAALAFYAEEKKITAKNFEEEYLNPAQAADARECVAYLLDWQNKK